MLLDESLSQSAKEEQYRHLEGDSNRQQPIQEMYVDPATQKIPEFSKSTGPPMPGFLVPHSGVESFDTAQQATQKIFKHENNLWTLPTSEYTEESVVEDSGLSTGTNVSNDTKSSQYITNQEENNVYKMPQEPTSSSSAYDFGSTSIDTESDKNNYSAYKFKLNMRKRFPKKVQVNSSNNLSSLRYGPQDRKCKMKIRADHCRSQSPCSFSTNYPNSDSSGGSSSVEVTGILPGFILHPNGTYYVPVSVYPTGINAEIFRLDNSCRPSISHPVNISVNFSGPGVCLRSVQEWKTDSTEARLGSGGSPGVPSSENSSGSPRERSPTNEPETKM